MKKLLTICLIAAAAVSITHAVPIKSISVTDVGTSFVGGIGSTLTMSDVGSINVEYTDIDNTVSPYAGGQFYLQTTLASQSTVGGIANGVFTGGIFWYKKNDNTLLLSGTIDYFNLTEAFNNSGIFFGVGSFTIDDNTALLKDDFGLGANMINISFSGPKGISNFDSAFTCSSDMTLLPTPEPATIALLGFGGLLLRKKNKS